jgi:hypothetical protein
MLAYEEGFAALDCCPELSRFVKVDASPVRKAGSPHGETETGNGLIMLVTPTPDYDGSR